MTMLTVESCAVLQGSLKRFAVIWSIFACGETKYIWARGIARIYAMLEMIAMRFRP